MTSDRTKWIHCNCIQSTYLLEILCQMKKKADLNTLSFYEENSASELFITLKNSSLWKNTFKTDFSFENKIISLFQKLSELVFFISSYLSNLSTLIEYSNLSLTSLFLFSSVFTSAVYLTMIFINQSDDSDFTLCRSFNEKWIISYTLTEETWVRTQKTLWHWNHWLS